MELHELMGMKRIVCGRTKEEETVCRLKCEYTNTALHYYELRVSENCVKSTIYRIQPVFYLCSSVAYLNNVDG